ALVEEASALAALGFENYESFVASIGGTAPDATAPTAATVDDNEPAGETIGRIRVLLAELGIDPGIDPLEAAKQFLDVIEEPSAAESDADAVEATTPPAPMTTSEVIAELSVAVSPPADASGTPPVDLPAPSDTLIPGGRSAGAGAPPAFGAPPVPSGPQGF